MPADMNRVNLVGRLTRDPETRTTAGGTVIANLRIALTTRVKEGEEWGDKSNYFDVTCFGRTAENVVKYMAKGRRIGVDGRLSWREWEKDGVKRQAVEVIAGDIFFLDAPAENGGGGGGERSAPAASTSSWD